MRHIWGFAFVLIYNVWYFFTAYVMKLALSDEAEADSEQYDKPIFVAYLWTSAFTLFLFKIFSKFAFTARFSMRNMPDKEIHDIEYETARKIFWFYMLSNISFYYGLSLTTITSSLILNNTWIIFVFILSLLVMNEKFSYMKLLATILSVSGIVLVALHKEDDTQAEMNTVGNLLVLVSAILWSFYLVYLNKWITPEIQEKVSFANILGFIGLMSMLTFWPMILIWHHTGIESFELPTGRPLLYIIINIVFGVYVYDYWWGKASILLSPLVVNCWDILVIPMSIIGEGELLGTEYPLTFYLGTTLIVSGFIIMVFKSYSKIMDVDQEKSSLLNSSQQAERSESSSHLKDVENH